MAVWSPSNIMLTQRGQELLSKVQAGVGQLSITKVVTGSGRVAASSLFTQTEVSSIKQTMAVTKVTTMSTGSNLELQVTNANLTTSYNINQIGVYAVHADMGEVLYMIAQCDEGTADIMPLASVTPVTMNYMFYLIHSSTTNLNITVDPAGLVSVGTFNEHLDNFQKLCDFVGYNDEQVYGVEIDYENNTYTRIGASAGLSPSDFDNLAPWGGRKRCNVTDDGFVVAYYGEPAYSENGYLKEAVTKTVTYFNRTEAGVNVTKTFEAGTPVQVMVEQPKFWYKTVPVKMEKQDNQSGYSLCKARYYVSLTPRPGFKVFPLFTRGIPLREADVAYLPAYRGSVYDVTPPEIEKFNLTVDRIPSLDGDIEIILDNAESKIITVKTSDTLVQIANKIANAGWENWTATSSATQPRVSFTSKTPGARSEATFKDPYYTNVGISFTSVTKGAGGYVENDAQIADFTIRTGDKLCSIAGVKPVSGSYCQKLSRYNASVLAKNRNYGPAYDFPMFSDGFGWQQKDLAANHCTLWLHLIEFATLDCQTTIGKGVVHLADDKVTNMAYKNGDTSTLGNRSGFAPEGVNGKCSVTYRGEENNWGNGSYWEEGLNINADYRNDAYYSVTGIYTDGASCKVEDGYKPLGFSLAKSNGYANRVGYSEDFDWGFLATRTTGSSNCPTHDYFSQNLKGSWFSSYRSGSWSCGNDAGLCSRTVMGGLTSYYRTISCCLMFVPEPLGTPYSPIEPDSYA